MRTPFLGGFDVGRSKNVADNLLINLYAEVVDTKQGKDVGAFYMCPGLDLLVTLGIGPIRGHQPMGGLLYVVSGNQVWTVDAGFTPKLLGLIATDNGPVSLINNGTQMNIFDGVSGYLVPGGFPLTGGAVAAAGTQYKAGDDVTLVGTGGSQSATAVVTITGVNGAGGVTGFTVTAAGGFPVQPTSFSQKSTSGSGSGLTITPSFGAFLGIITLDLPFAGPVSASYQDGFGLVNENGTDIWWQSDLFDLSVYEPLNFSSADGKPSAIVAIKESHREQWLFKSDCIEVWVDAGVAGFSFQRLDGVFIEVGCAAPFAVTLVGEALFWLTQNKSGQGQVVMANGYQPRRVSTHAIEREIASYPTIADATVYTYQQEGHQFVVFCFPSGNATWCYDMTASQDFGVPVWHKRAAFANGKFSRHWAHTHSFFAGRQVVGDFRNGNLYAFNLATQTDAGTQRKWVRSWRALPKPSIDPVRFSVLQIDMQTGMGVAPADNPLCMLRWSDDGGHNWSSERFASVGKAGQTARRVRFPRLGSTKRNQGLDRLFELSSTDAFGVALIGADLT